MYSRRNSCGHMPKRERRGRYYRRREKSREHLVHEVSGYRALPNQKWEMEKEGDHCRDQYEENRYGEDQYREKISAEKIATEISTEKTIVTESIGK